MKFKHFIFIFFLFILLPQSSKSEITDGIVAVINDELILLSDLRKHIKGSGENPLNKKVYSKYLKELIDLKLLELQGKRMGMEVTKDQLDLLEKDMREKKGSEEFEKEIKNLGLNIYRIRFVWRNQFLQESIGSIILRNKIVVTEKEIKDYYRKNYGEIKEENLVKLSLVIINNKKLTKEEIKEIGNRFKSNTDSDELIKEYLEKVKIERSSGNLGYLNPKNLDSDIVDSVLHAELGSIIGPFHSGDLVKYFIIRDKTFGDINYLKNREEIIQTIYGEKTLFLLNDWFQKLRDNSYISIRI